MKKPTDETPDQATAVGRRKTADHSNKRTKFPIVGIGASAGGLEAFEQFFDAMPVNSGIAFILISQLDPTHVSLLPELIQKR